MKKMLANDAIRNKQIVPTSTKDASEDGITHYEGTPNIEKATNHDGCQETGQQCFTIDEYSILQDGKCNLITMIFPCFD